MEENTDKNNFVDNPSIFDIQKSLSNKCSLENYTVCIFFAEAVIGLDVGTWALYLIAGCKHCVSAKTNIASFEVRCYLE